MIENDILILAVFWAVLFASSTCLGIYRSLIDRIRSGLTTAPEDEDRSVSKLISKTLILPNHERPFHLEAAFLSSLLVLTGFFLLRSWIPSPSLNWALLLFSILIERISSWLLPRKISQSKNLNSFLKGGYLPVVLFIILCKPLVILLTFLESLIQSSSQKKILEEEEENELADHIRAVGREGTNLDPDVLEIMGNTLEMSQLKIKDVMIPRNQVQILDDNDSFQKNLEIAKSCGHTRLPLCKGNLDHCMGIIHVKYAFRTISEFSDDYDLKKLTKSPALLSSEELLPFALKRMMKLKVHMALVRDEFGGIDGVITLEDILEEVVGEIQDEFDAEEEDVVKISEGEWTISGLTPLHELPTELQMEEPEGELTSLGGMLTREIGKIPQLGETFEFQNFEVEILDADETRVQSVKVRVKSGTESQSD